MTTTTHPQKKRVEKISFLIIGTLLYSLYISLLLSPNDIGSGGIMGITLVVQELFHTPIGLTQLLLNIPLFILGFRFLRKRFMFLSGIIVIASSFLIDWIPTQIVPESLNDPLVASIFAGLVSGLAMALIFFGGASTGGLDILGKFFFARFHNWPLPRIFLMQDLVIYILVWWVFDLKHVMYALIMSFVRAKALQTVYSFYSASKQCIIICEKADEINEVITKELGRGVTILDARGGYSNRTKKMVYVVVQNNEIVRLQEIVSSVEPNAFVTFSEIHTVFGNYKEHSYSF
ncbi:YitT family protein [Exiguobacterium acetylicum]|uniref:YitT family protein n=1 Tax=Exiguobacterium acetylicum TaxID=41170 RepID=UPI001EE23767|nr:YitT family protein [Exiguobacterium acetylicum]UKS56626.1 YitT family protein [Exiguobacterium acetylicum]